MAYTLAMHDKRFFPGKQAGYDFIPREFIPPGKSEHWYRDVETVLDLDALRPLSDSERKTLEQNGNRASSWDEVLVSDPFDINLIQNSSFYGLVRIGPLREGLLHYHDLAIPAGIYHSTIVASDIGENCSVRHVGYLSHYIVGKEVILSRIDEMQCSNHAKFGNGIITPGEKEEVRVSIDVINENGGRAILPFEDMITADAYLWACWRDDSFLVQRLAEITQKQYGTERGRYGYVGNQTVIKSSNIIKDCRIGESAYIKGANKLKNLTILSSDREKTQIGEGVELVNGIIGYGCRIFYGSKAVRFVMGRNSSLKYGARLIHSVLGDNSTVSCCEILNNLIFPSHEQHHNNSFLIASLVGGLSNMAAGATIGSNHNSRAPDGELRAKRGFWPGLTVSLKHPSVFASYTLISKGHYPCELNIPLPFSLVAWNQRHMRIEVMGAYFWMYNLYALERNTWKVAERDRRAEKVQIVHTDYLLPDTAEEILKAMELLALWVGQSILGAEAAENRTKCLEMGFKVLRKKRDPFAPGQEFAHVSVVASEIDSSHGDAIILKPWQSFRAYSEMLEYYCGKSLAIWFTRPEAGSLQSELRALVQDIPKLRRSAWQNMGGQIMAEERVDAIRADIKFGKLDSWQAIHAAYHRAEQNFVRDCAQHALGMWAELLETRPIGLEIEAVKACLLRSADISKAIAKSVRSTRQKDLEDPYRLITYRNAEELTAVLGKMEDNPFVKLSAEKSKSYIKMIQNLVK